MRNKLFDKKKSISILLCSALFLSGLGTVCLADSEYTVLVNENFENGYVDRGDVRKNFALSEKYNGYADKTNRGYMVFKQITSYSYLAENADRYGYGADERISSGYSSTYGNLGSALYLYPNSISENDEWWVSTELKYDAMPLSEISKKTIDINFSFADNGEEGRVAAIRLCADINGRETEFPIGYKSIKRGTQFLNSYHKRVNLGEVLKDISSDDEVSNVWIKLAAKRGKYASLVKIDDIHIREVNPKEVTGWDFEAEDLFTNDFDKSAAALSTADADGADGRALKIKALKDGECGAAFPIRDIDKNSTLKISLKALVPYSNSKKNGAEIKLVNIGTQKEWKIGKISNSDSFKEFSRELNLSEFYGVGDDLSNAKIKICFDGDTNDVCYVDDLSVCRTDSGSTANDAALVSENFEEGYTDRGAVHNNITLSEKYNGFADNSQSGYMVYKQITANTYTDRGADREYYDTDNRDYSTLSEQWGKLGSAIYLYPSEDGGENWWISVSTGYMPMSVRDMREKALDINITFSDTGSGGREADATLCFKANGEEKEVCIDKKPIKCGKAFRNSYHRRISLAEILSDLSENDVIIDLRFKLSAPKGNAASRVMFDDIHIRETDPNEICGWNFEAEDLYTTDFSYMTERLSSVRTDGANGKALKICAINAQYLKQTRFSIPDIDKKSVLDISFKIKLPTTNAVLRGTDIQLRYMDNSGDINIGHIENSDKFAEFRKTVSLSEIKGILSEFSRAVLEIKFEGAVGDVCYIDDLSIKIHSEDTGEWAELPQSGGEYFPTEFLYIHFNRDIDAESVKHTGNVRINDSVGMINRIEMVNSREMIITLSEKMESDCRYIVEMRNLRSAFGDELAYKCFDVLIKDDRSYAAAAAECALSYADGEAAVVLPFVVNCDTDAREFTYLAAAYGKNGELISSSLQNINLESGEYLKNIRSGFETSVQIAKVKAFLWYTSWFKRQTESSFKPFSISENNLSVIVTSSSPELNISKANNRWWKNTVNTIQKTDDKERFFQKI